MTPASQRELHQRMEAAAASWRLPFRSLLWRGHSGNWLGAGIGSSIDFQDHRPYLPGDDPRYIDWRAYARTGHYLMKLYREEVSPLVDLVLDCSRSMFFDEVKAARSLELFYFCIKSAEVSNASLRGYLACGTEIRVLAREQLEQFSGPGPESDQPVPPALERVPWRQGSLRVLISDLLFPAGPELLLRPLGSGRGRGMIFVPFCKGEAAPEWSGNVEFEDCESHHRRLQRVTAELRARYTQSYRRHFALWREQARKHAVTIARVPGEPSFREALTAEALPVGAVELC